MDEETGPVGALTHVGVDVADLEQAEAFYSALLGVRRRSAWNQYLLFEPLPTGLSVYLQRVPDKKTSKTRVHIDLTVPDVLAALARVEALGGRVVRESGGSRRPGRERVLPDERPIVHRCRANPQSA